MSYRSVGAATKVPGRVGRVERDGGLGTVVDLQLQVRTQFHAPQTNQCRNAR